MYTNYMKEGEKMELATAISCIKGVITVIGPVGNLEMYRHPLVDKLSKEEIAKGKSNGTLEMNIEEYETFPENYEIETEEPEIMGDMSTYYDFNMEGI